MTDFARLKLLVMDVDGVLTDGRIYLDEDGREIKAFDTKDGAGVKYWQRVGHTAAIITGRGSPTVQRRAEELGIEIVHLNAKIKLPAFQSVLAQTGATAEETVVIGDDLTDLPLLRACGFAAAPADAVADVREAAEYVAAAGGGRGCVREVVEHVLKAAGTWGRIMERYLPKGGDDA